MNENEELVKIIIDITELRDKSSYKKIYDEVLARLKGKLKRQTMKFKTVDSPPIPIESIVQSASETVL